MKFDRRRLFAAIAGAASAGAATPSAAREPFAVASVPHSEIDATSLGVRPNADIDQSAMLQSAIARAAAAGSLLRLPPGVYRAGALQLPPFAAIAGVIGSTRLIMTAGPSLLTATGSDYVSISGLVLDGNHVTLPDGRGLVHLTQGRALRLIDCMIINAGGNGVTLDAIAGQMTGITVIDAANHAIFSNDAAGLRVAGNTVQRAGNGGILVWRSKPGDDGTLVVDNRIEDVANKAGGSGQYGNAINVFRADNVIVRGNRIRNAAFSAVRGTSASNLQIVGNTCSGLGECAIYAEFGFEGAVIANNIVDGAAVGVSVTNFDKGGRLGVVQGNLIRNLVRQQPPGSDPNDTIGISVEADTVVNGNIVESAKGVGIQAGWGSYLRDVTITANIVRNTDYGITVSVASGAGTAVIANNLVSGTPLGAIVGKEWAKTVTGDLSKEGAERYAQLSIDGNRVR
ncbi:MAG TPA: TIGR03808 family TAT-translocated repetitive protein [Xanthobacteraceae bacterium]|nr:TIGR03808 family TAT-translocated repetitive protein [Xanthobacteraceae bacterium]